jgi:TatD family hydrolase
MMFADSHCHLNYKGVFEQQGDVLARARSRGVGAMLNISTRESEWDAVVATAEREPDVWASIGIHPHEADQHPDVDIARLVDRAAHPRIVGIGESGLDYYYDHSDRARQQASFRSHIGACRETGLPLIVHTRDAEEDTLAILRDEMGKGAYPGVIHCFTASGDFADKALEIGLLYLDLGDRDVQECARPAGDGGPAADRTAADRDRCPISGAGAASRQTGRACFRRGHRDLPRPAARRAHRRAGRTNCR